MTAAVTLHAKWTIGQSTLTYTAGANGSITGTTPQAVTNGGNGTAVTAVPAVGFRFEQWSDGNTTNPRTDTNVTSSISVTASFVARDAVFAGTSKYAWSENAGWLTFNATGGKVSAKLGAGGYLSGLAWAENLGWVKFAGTENGVVFVW